MALLKSYERSCDRACVVQLFRPLRAAGCAHGSFAAGKREQRGDERDNATAREPRQSHFIYRPFVEFCRARQTWRAQNGGEV